MLVTASHVFAQFNEEINYQGKLLDNTGATVSDGDYEITYRLYNQATGGSALFTEVATSTVTSGLFSYLIGSSTSLSGVDFNQTLYLSIEVNGDGEMTPRKRLGAVPAAFEAKNAQTLAGIATTSFLRADEADTASGLLTFTGGLIANSSSTIIELNTGTTTMTVLDIGGETYTDITGVGLSVTGGALTVDLGTTIEAAELADADFGSFTVSTGVATIDTDAITPDMVASGSQVDEYCLTYEAGDTWQWQDCGTSVSLGGLNDVLTGGVSGGDILMFDGTNWVDVSTSTLLTEAELSTEAELETLLTDVTNVFTNNDGALSDDDLSDNDTDDLAEGTNLYYTDARVAAYINGSSTILNLATEAGLEAYLADATNVFTNNDTITSANIADSYLFNTGDTATGIYTFTGTTTFATSTFANVGVGSSTPDKKLTVEATGESVVEFNLLSASSDTILTLNSSDGVIGNGSFFLRAFDGGSTMFSVRGDGVINAGDRYQISGVNVLTADTLGTNVVNSSLTSVGTITTGEWSGTEIADAYVSDTLTIGSGATIADGLIVEADLDLNTPTDGYILAASSTASGGFAWYATSSNYLNLAALDTTLTTGSDNQIPFTNAGGTDFEYSSNFTFDGTDLNLGASNGLAFGGTRMFYASSTNNSIYIGEDAGNLGNGTGLNSVAIGYRAGYNTLETTSEDESVFVGYHAGYNSAGADRTTAIGFSAGREATGHNGNLLGYYAGYRNSANYVTSVGTAAGQDNSGTGLAALGHYAGRSNSGANVTAVGYQAGYFNTGDYLTAVGAEIARYSDGIRSTFMGYQAAYGEDTVRDEVSDSVILGYRAGYKVSTSSKNVYIGALAGDSITTGSSNIFIGYNVDYSSTTASNILNIGNILYGAGIDGTGTTLSTGGIAIGTTSASNARLTIQSQGTTDILNLFETSGSEVFTVLENGNVGVGTSTPDNTLSITGDVNIDGNIGIGWDSSGNPVQPQSDAYMYMFTHSSGKDFIRLQRVGYDGQFNLNSGSSGRYRLDMGSTIAMQFDSRNSYQGNVGFDQRVSIGTSTANADVRLRVQTTGTDDILNLFEANGAEILTVLETGELGIGTTTPFAELSVVGDAAITGALYDNNGSVGTNGMVLQTTGTGFAWVATSTLGLGGGGSFSDYGADTQIPYMNGTSDFSYSSNFTFDGSTLSVQTTGTADILNLFETGGTEVFTVLESGNVGIGTSTPPAMLSVDGGDVMFGTSELVISGGTNTGITFDTSAGTIRASADSGTAMVLNRFNSGGTALNINYNGSYEGGIKATSSVLTLIGSTELALQSNGNERVRIDSTGKVGIGTTTPATNLHVYDGPSGGSANANAKLVLEDINTTYIQFLSPNTTSQGLLFGDSANNVVGRVTYSHADNDLQLWTAGSQQMTIDSNGDVGIGTTSPSALLTVGNGVMSTVDGTNDLYVTDDIEADGALYVAGTGNFESIVSATIFEGVADTYGMLRGDTNIFMDLDDDNDGAGEFRIRDGANTTAFTINESGQVTTGIWQGTAVDSTYLDTNVLLDTELSNSSQLAGLLSDETGAGNVVFSASPTLSGTVAMAAATFSGDVTGTTNSSVQFTHTDDADAFVFTQSNGTTGEKDVFTILDSDSGGNGQDESSTLKVHRSGVIDAASDGQTLVELTYTGGGTIDADEQFYMLGRTTDEGAPTWGVALSDADIWTEGALRLGATGVDCGSTDAPCFNNPAFEVTAAGVVASGTWNGNIIDEAYLDSDVTLLGATIDATELASEDFGDFTCNGTSCSLDNDVVAAAEMANSDHGFFSYDTGVASLDTDGLSSANLVAAVSDETGSGVMVFATSPTLVTPVLGVADATEINFVNQEPTDLTADGDVGFDASRGLIIYRTQQVGQESGNGTYTVLDTSNITGGTNLTITNTASGTSGTEAITFAVDDAFILNSGGDSATGDYTFNGTTTLTNTNGIGNNILQISGDTDAMVWNNFANGDYSLYNNQQNNGINFYDGTGGVEFVYNGSAVAEIDSTGGFEVLSGGIDVTGGATIAGDANFDSGTLFVDVSANSVGIGTTSPSATFAVENSASGGAGTGIRLGNGTDVFDLYFSSTGADSPVFLSHSKTGQVEMQFAANGNITIGDISSGQVHIGRTLSIGSGGEGTVDGYEDVYVTDDLEVDGSSYLAGNVVLEGAAANIALGSNYLSGDGDDEGISIDSAGAVTTSNDLVVSDHLAVGAPINSARIVNIAGTLTSDSTAYGVTNITDYAGSMTANRTVYANFNRLDLNGYALNGNSLTGNAVYGSAKAIDGNDDVGTLRGGYFLADNENTTGTVNASYGIEVVTLTDANATTTSAAGLRTNLTNSGQIDTYYGILLTDVVEGGQNNAYAIWANEGDVILDGDGDGSAGGTNAGSDLFFGEGQDAAIWYGGTNLNIDPDIVGTGQLYVRGDMSIHNGSNEIITFYDTENVATGPDIQFKTSSLIAAEGSLNFNLDSDNNSTNEKFVVLTNGDTNAATELFRINEDGNVGIGTTTPPNKLSIDVTSNDGARVSGTVADSIYYFVNNLSNNSSAYSEFIAQNDSGSLISTGIGSSNTTADVYGNRGYLYSNAALSLIANNVSGDIRFFTGGDATSNQAMVIDSSGNVGIGTTTPDSVLNLVDDDPILLVKDTSTTITNANVKLRLAESASGGLTDNYWDVKVDPTGSNFAFHIAHNENEYFTLNSSGNVGIGTTTPQKSLDIAGDGQGSALRLSDTDTVLSDGEFGPIIEFFTSDANNSGAHAYIATYGNGSTGNLDMAFGSGLGTEAMRIDAQGNVGIGTSSPGARLHVIADSGDAAIRLEENTGGEYFTIEIDSSGDMNFRSDSSSSRLSLLDASDDVGINDTHPDANFEVSANGNTGGAAVMVSSDDSNDGDLLTLLHTGYLGIGTATPATLLEISAETAGSAGLTIRADTDNDNEDDNPFIEFLQDGDAVNAYLGLVGTAGNSPNSAAEVFTDTLTNSLLLGSVGNYPVQFGRNSAVNMTIGSSGYVGIGTTSPVAQLTVGSGVPTVATGDDLYVTDDVEVGDDAFIGDQLDVGGHMAVGSGAAVSAYRGMYMIDAINADSALYGIDMDFRVTQNLGSTNRTNRGVRALLQADAVTENAYNADFRAFDAEVQVDGTSTVNDAIAFYANIDQNSSGVIDNAYGAYFTLDNAAGGTITNTYGIRIIDVVEGTQTNAYALYIDEGDLVLDGDGDGIVGGTHAGSDLFFGEGFDAAIWYDGTDLNIDPNIVGSGLVDVGGDMAIGGAFTMYDNNAVASSPDIEFTASGVLAFEDTAYINIDSDNLDTTDAFVIQKNANTNAGTEIFRVDESGNADVSGELTVGTGNAFTINTGGEIINQLHVSVSTNVPGLFQNTTSGKSVIELSNSDETWSVGQGSSENFIIGNVADDDVFKIMDGGARSNALVIDADGDVSVGAGTDASYKLDVTDSSAGYIAIFDNTNGGNGADGVIIKTGDVDPGTGAEFIEFRNSAGTSIDTIEGDGAGATRYTGNAAGTYSDRRVKENIVDYDANVFDLINDFRTVEFNYISGPNSSTTRTGFIAQEVLQIYPQAINFGDDLSGIAEADLPRLRMNYGEVTPLLTAAIQDISTILDITAASTTQTAMTVDIDGNIAVGTTTATAQLTTDGSVRFANFGAGTLQTDALGNLMVSSDERLKDIISTTTTGLEAVLAIEPIKYHWKVEAGFDTEGEYVGFSAQNVETVLPDAVSYDKNGFRTVSDRTILAAVISAVQEMWTKVTGNEERIESLEAENEALKARLEAIEDELQVEASAQDSNPTNNSSDGTGANNSDSDSTPQNSTSEDETTASSTEAGTENSTSAETAVEPESESDADEQVTSGETVAENEESSTTDTPALEESSEQTEPAEAPVELEPASEPETTEPEILPDADEAPAT